MLSEDTSPFQKTIFYIKGKKKTKHIFQYQKNSFLILITKKLFLKIV